MAFEPSENPITNPTRESYTELRPFRFWCQKVLPLVYDDSLSYYELLCKVVDYLNKTMEDVDHMNTDMDTLYTNFQSFQEGTFRIYNELVDYVNTYFDELDVQDAIDNKLDEMVTSGELVTILQPSIADEVSNWLEEHITPTTPSIDDSLTVSGACADAKKTGDALSLTYSNNKKYAVGEFCLYNGIIYKCVTKISTGEAFDSSKWVATNLTTELFNDYIFDYDNKENLYGYYESLNNIFDSVFDSNIVAYLCNITKTVKTTERYIHTDFVLNVEEGKTYYYNIGDIINQISAQYASIVFYNNDTEISRTNINNKTGNFTVPSNTTKTILEVYFVLNVFPSEVTSVVYEYFIITENSLTLTYSLKDAVSSNIIINKDQADFIESNVLINGNYEKNILQGQRFVSSEILIDIPKNQIFTFNIDNYSEGIDAQVAQIDVLDSSNNVIYTTPVSKTMLANGGKTFSTNENARYCKVTLWFSTTTIAQQNITVTYYGVKLYGSETPRYVINANQNNKIYCIGDSLTMGAGAGSSPYPSILQSLLPDFSVVNYGIGGEGSDTICARMCGFYVDPFTIPADTSTVQINIKSLFNTNISPLLQSNNYSTDGVNPVYINGIEGIISVVISGNNRTYYFSRTDSGSEINVSRPSFVYTKALLSNNYDSIAIIWCGTNDIYAGVDDTVEYKNMGYTISRIKQMIKQLKTDKYIVVSLTIVNRPGVQKLRENVIEFNTLASLEFGNNYANVVDYLISYGLADANITPTEQDLNDIQNGKVPTSLMSDNTHLNSSGYNVVANYIYKQGHILDYW